jgi:hypothetical protein
MVKFAEQFVEALAAAVLIAGAVYIVLFNGAVLL